MYSANYKNIFSCNPKILSNPRLITLSCPLICSWKTNIECDLYCKDIYLSCNKILLLEGSITIQGEQDTHNTISVYINQKKVTESFSSGELSTVNFIWGNAIHIQSCYDQKVNIRITVSSTTEANIMPSSVSITTI